MKNTGESFTMKLCQLRKILDLLCKVVDKELSSPLPDNPDYEIEVMVLLLSVKSTLKSEEQNKDLALKFIREFMN